MAATSRVAIKLAAGEDADELDQLTRMLRAELLELDVEDVEFIPEDHVPEGAKGFGLVAAGALIVNLVHAGALTGVVSAVKAWASRDAGRSAKLVIDSESIELKGVSSVQQDELIEQWVRLVSRKLDAEH